MASEPVAIIMGSQSDSATMKHAAKTLDALKIAYEDAHYLRPSHSQAALRLRRQRA